MGSLLRTVVCVALMRRSNPPFALLCSSSRLPILSMHAFTKSVRNAFLHDPRPPSCCTLSSWTPSLTGFSLTICTNRPDEKKSSIISEILVRESMERFARVLAVVCFEVTSY